MPTNKQLSFVTHLCAKHQKTIPENIKTMTKGECSAVIRMLLKQDWKNWTYGDDTSPTNKQIEKLERLCHKEGLELPNYQGGVFVEHYGVFMQDILPLDPNRSHRYTQEMCARDIAIASNTPGQWKYGVTLRVKDETEFWQGSKKEIVQPEHVCGYMNKDKKRCHLSGKLQYAARTAFDYAHHDICHHNEWSMCTHNIQMAMAKTICEKYNKWTKEELKTLRTQREEGMRRAHICIAKMCALEKAGIAAEKKRKRDSSPKYNASSPKRSKLKDFKSVAKQEVDLYWQEHRRANWLSISARIARTQLKRGLNDEELEELKALCKAKLEKEQL